MFFSSGHTLKRVRVFATCHERDERWRTSCERKKFTSLIKRRRSRELMMIFFFLNICIYIYIYIYIILLGPKKIIEKILGCYNICVNYGISVAIREIVS
jgi:hypothetical protein